jgi:hypothetical protein
LRFVISAPNRRQDCCQPGPKFCHGYWPSGGAASVPRFYY